MQKSLLHIVTDESAAAEVIPGSHTQQAGVRRSTSDNASNSDSFAMFDQLSAIERMKMQLVARASASPAHALPTIISFLVEGDEVKQQAIVKAVSENEHLNAQWERAWHQLRA